MSGEANQQQESVRRRSPLTINSIIDWVRSEADRSELYCVYGKADTEPAALTATCYLDDHPTITDDYEEHFPDFVTREGLEIWYRDELIQDVVANALHQKPNVSNETILTALEYYTEKDCFKAID